MQFPVDRMKFMASQTPLPPPAGPVIRPADDDGGSVVAERKTQKTKPPQMYQVVMLNDDFTPMEFVVMVLQEYFKRDLETATQIMLKIHHEGRGVCGVFTKDVAATKVELVLTAARHAGRPAPAPAAAAGRAGAQNLGGRGVVEQCNQQVLDGEEIV